MNSYVNISISRFSIAGNRMYKTEYQIDRRTDRRRSMFNTPPYEAGHVKTFCNTPESVEKCNADHPPMDRPSFTACGPVAGDSCMQCHCVYSFSSITKILQWVKRRVSWSPDVTFAT